MERFLDKSDLFRVKKYSPQRSHAILYSNKEDSNGIERKNKRIVAKAKDKTKSALQEI